MSLEKIIEPYITGYSSFTFKTKEHDYIILSCEFGVDNNAPCIFVINKDGVLAVSNEYPKTYRRLGLIHEIIEKQWIKNGDDICLLALKEELALAESELPNFEHYLSFRLKFFEDLIDHYETCEHRDNAEIIALCNRMRLSRDHLQTLVPV